MYSIRVTCISLMVLFLVSVTMAGTINVPGDYALVQDAINNAIAGDTIQVAAGSYIHSGHLNVNKSLTIQGAGRDVTFLKRSGIPGKYDYSIYIPNTTSNVIIKDLTVGWETLTSDGMGYVISTSAPYTTLNNIHIGDNYRAWVLTYADYLEISDCLFDGTYGRGGIRGAAEHFLITRNQFMGTHYEDSTIYIEWGDPWSGVISYNYFKVNVADGWFNGDYKHSAIGVVAGGITSDGLQVIHNTFDWAGKNVQNSNGDYAMPFGVYFDPVLAVPDDKLIIKDNIFANFDYAGNDSPEPPAAPLWHPTEGVFGGALEFDGVDDYAWFKDAAFDVGATGTLVLWVKRNGTGARHMIGAGPDGLGLEFQIRHSDEPYFYPNSDEDTLIWSSNTIDTSWHHLAFTWSKGDNEGRIYLDGAEVSYQAGYDPDLSGGWINPVNTINGLFTIAKDPAVAGRELNGWMDDMAFYNDVLTPAELADVIANGVSAHSDLVAAWNFDQSSGETVSGAAGTAIDLHIVTENMPTWQPTEGQFGGALEFNGLDQYASFSDDDFDVGSKGSLAVWVKCDNLDKRNQIIRGGGIECQVRHSHDVYFGPNTGEGWENISWSDTLIPDNNWHHLTFTWDFDVKEARIYMDGTEVTYDATYDWDLSDTWTYVATTINELMYVGRDPADGTRFFDGMMDDMGWYDKVLSTSDISTIMTSGISADPNLVAHWNLDNASGKSAPGNSGTNITLYLQQGPAERGHGVRAPSNTVVSNNLFYNNEINSDPAGDSTNKVGDPLFLEVGTDLDEYYRLKGGSPALRTASDGTNIGANQEIPSGAVWVDDDYTAATGGWNVTHFDNITDALDVVDTTGTVTVYAGRYNENIHSTKGVSMIGDGMPFIEGSGSGTGILVEADDFSITGFAIHSFDRGIDIITTGSATIEGCYLFKNTEALRNQNAGLTVMAENNWWGDNSGPGGSGNPVSGLVDYDPWIGKSGDTRGAGYLDIGGTGTFATGTGLSEIVFINSSASQVALIILNEGPVTQGFYGFPDGKGINRKVAIMPYGINDGEFLATLKMYYTQQDLIDASIDSGGWLSIRVWDDLPNLEWIYAYLWNVGASENIHQGDSASDTTLGHYGTYTAGFYAWANIDHMSEFAAGQDPTVPVELSIFNVE